MKVGGFYFSLLLIISYLSLLVLFTERRGMEHAKKNKIISLWLKRRNILNITMTSQYQSFFVCVCDQGRVLRVTVKNLNYLHMLKTDRKIKHRLYRFK